MIAGTLVLGSALGYVVAALYAALCVLQLRKARAPGAGSRRFFALFWAGIGAHAAVESTYALAVAFAPPSLGVGIVVLIVKMLTGLVAFMGLVCYLLMVYTGHPRVVVPVAAFYAFLYVFATYAYLSRVPLAQETRVWYAGLVYEHPEGALHAAMVVLLFLPPLVCALTYALLVRVSRDRPQRARILATSLALAAFFATFLFGWMNERWYWWGLVERALPIATSLGVLLAERAPTDARDAPAASAA